MDFMNSILGGGVPAQGQGTATQIIKGATDGVAPKRPISLEAQQSLQRFENSTTFNNNNASNITLSLDKGLVANSRGGLPAGVHLRGYNLGSSLA
jgi:hypothetical protein